MRINAKLSEAALSAEEMTSRVAAMEKKLQKALAEKDTLLTENKVRERSDRYASQTVLFRLCRGVQKQTARLR